MVGRESSFWRELEDKECLKGKSLPLLHWAHGGQDIVVLGLCTLRGRAPRGLVAESCIGCAMARTVASGASPWSARSLSVASAEVGLFRQTLFRAATLYIKEQPALFQSRICARAMVARVKNMFNNASGILAAPVKPPFKFPNFSRIPLKTSTLRRTPPNSHFMFILAKASIFGGANTL